jgi:hypothetical protein
VGQLYLFGGGGGCSSSSSSSSSSSNSSSSDLQNLEKPANVAQRHSHELMQFICCLD